MMILIADDDPVQTLLLTTRLKQRGYKVDTAINAIQAWMVAIRRPPDAIILDIQMPGGTGYAVLKQIKSSSKTMRVPVIVLSGSIDSSDQAKLKELGADEFLSKPVDLTQLFATLSKLLEPPVETPTKAAEVNVTLSPDLDIAALLKHVDGDVELLQKLWKVFWEDCPRMLSDIRKALDDKSPKGLQMAAHALKGSLSYFGTNSAFQTALKLEKLGQEGTMGGAAKLLLDLEEGLSELKPALAALGEESGACRSMEAA
jgi:CheY-like chemotaxis protein